MYRYVPQDPDDVHANGLCKLLCQVSEKLVGEPHFVARFDDGEELAVPWYELHPWSKQGLTST